MVCRALMASVQKLHTAGWNCSDGSHPKVVKWPQSSKYRVNVGRVTWKPAWLLWWAGITAGCVN